MTQTEETDMLKSAGQVRIQKEYEWMKRAHKLEGSERGTIRKRKGTERARGTYVLLSKDGANGQDTEENRKSGGY